MGDFSLNLQAAEEHLDEDDTEGDVVLDVLDGSTPSEEWVQSVARENVLFPAIEGDLNKLVSGFARDIKDMDGQLMHFRKFLVISSPGVDTSTDDL